MPEWMPSELRIYYHLVARAEAAIGANDAAIRYLGKAIDNGRTCPDSTKNCGEFNSLPETREWEDLMTELERKSRKSIRR